MEINVKNIEKNIEKNGRSCYRALDEYEPALGDHRGRIM